MSSLWCHVQFSVKFLICPLLPALLYYSSTITDKAKDTFSLFFSFLPPQRFQTLLDFQILYRGAGLRVDSYRPWSLHTLVCVVWNSIWVGVQECYLPFIHRFMWGIKSTVFLICLVFCIVDTTAFFIFLMTPWLADQISENRLWNANL